MSNCLLLLTQVFKGWGLLALTFLSCWPLLAFVWLAWVWKPGLHTDGLDCCTTSETSSCWSFLHNWSVVHKWMTSTTSLKIVGWRPVMHPSLTNRLLRTDKNTKERRLHRIIPESSSRRSERGRSSIHNDLMDPSKYSRSAKLKNMSSIKKSKWTAKKTLGVKAKVFKDTTLNDN